MSRPYYECVSGGALAKRFAGAYPNIPLYTVFDNAYGDPKVNSFSWKRLPNGYAHAAINGKVVTSDQNLPLLGSLNGKTPPRQMAVVVVAEKYESHFGHAMAAYKIDNMLFCTSGQVHPDANRHHRIPFAHGAASA